MLQIRCPWCGPREEREFHYGGEAHLPYPGPDADDAAWARFLYSRRNPAGDYAERWVHVAGCRRWFHVVRNTLTNDIRGSYLTSETPGEAQ